MPSSETYYRKLNRPNGILHVYANNIVYSNLSPKVFRIADSQLRIPNLVHFSYTPDAHESSGTCIGTTAVWRMRDGYISPSIVGSDIGCGIRVHLTGLTKDDIQDIGLRRKLVRVIEKVVPLLDHTPSNYRSLDMEAIVKQGLYGLPDKYLNDRSLSHVEAAQFSFDHNHLDEVSPVMWKRGNQHIGSLGAGNHFIELQVVSIAEENKEVAAKWGLFDGQVIVLIHSGSRGWARMLRSQYTREFQTGMKRLKLRSTNPKLLYMPLDSPEGQTYLNLMYSALNYAVVNRHLMAYAVANALKQVFGTSEMPVLYDLMHNYALEEQHQNQQMLVHRKGATRALPAGHALNPAVYQETGHPALIPGSMGTASYIMVGKNTAEQNYYSICHGAGRVFSSQAVQEQIAVDQASRSLRIGSEDEIVVNRWAMENMLSEAPAVYKDVDQVIDSVVGAKMASVVAKCTPVLVLKAT